MSEPTLEFRINDILINQLNASEDALQPSTRLEELGVDSLDRVEIIMACESEFSKELKGRGLSDEAMEQVTTVGELYAAVRGELENADRGV